MTINLKTGQPFPRGCNPSPKALRAAAPLFTPPIAAPPEQVVWVPVKIDTEDGWGNYQFGVCVTSDEAYAKACAVTGGPAGVFIPATEVIRWARAHGVLNGASLIEVLQGMKAKGFVIGSQTYNDGDFAEVSFDNEGDLKAALVIGPVKIAIDADALPSGAGNYSGWFSLAAKTYRGTDHCIPILGYGKAKWIYEQFGLPLPAGLPPDTEGYAIGTWGTWGFVVYKWIPGCTDEAWVRFPTTVGVPPLPSPTPAPPPPPPPGPGPTPTPGLRPESVLMSDGTRYLCVSTM